MVPFQALQWCTIGRSQWDGDEMDNEHVYMQ